MMPYSADLHWYYQWYLTAVLIVRLSHFFNPGNTCSSHQINRHVALFCTLPGTLVISCLLKSTRHTLEKTSFNPHHRDQARGTRGREGKGYIAVPACTRVTRVRRARGTAGLTLNHTAPTLVLHLPVSPQKCTNHAWPAFTTHKAFYRAKLAGLHGAITPAPTSFASVCRGSQEKKS
eukprot:1146958-Pelagomonas_calceolata.AAC.1